MTAEQFYQRLTQGGAHPTTSQPTPGAFLEVFKAAKAAGATEIVAMVISKAMSGTYQSAIQAAEQMDIPVHVHDSRNNSMGLGWQVMAAARARESGADARGMLKAAESVRERMTYYVSLDTIEYLARGGRIGSAVNFINSLIKIKPLVYVRPDSGTVAPGLPARSRAAALEGLYKAFFRQVGQGALHITVLHNNAEEEAKALEVRVRAEHNPKELFTSLTSPVLGAHTGPRAVALCGYAEG
jgi:DegV family protein with EDD domain